MYPIGSMTNLRATKVGRYAFDTFKIEETYHYTGKEIVVYCPYYKADERRSTSPDTVLPSSTQPAVT